MNPNEITTVTRPSGTILVNPSGMAFVYDFINGEDVLSLLVEDKRLGALQVALSPAAAQHVAAHLTAMAGDVTALRAEWHRRQGGEPS